MFLPLRIDTASTASTDSETARARRDLRGVVLDFFAEKRAKEVARDLDVSPRAVRNWAQGESGMSDEALIAAARRYPEFRAAVMRLMADDADVRAGEGAHRD